MAAESYSSKHLLCPNDILFARTGGTVGKTYFYDGKIGEAVFAGYCIRFRFDKSKVIPKFVYWYTKTDTYQKWVNGIQRPVGQPNINKEEYKSFEIILPSITIQQKLVDYMDAADFSRKDKLYHADDILDQTKNNVFETFGIHFEEYVPTLYSFTKLKNLLEIGIYCNPHSDYLNSAFSHLRENEFYAGALEDFVEINPTTSREGLHDSTSVSFVPMPAVEEKTNNVIYEVKQYKKVKTGFTIFQKDDLLSWIKKNNIGNVEKLHIDDVINLYDEIYKYVPKKVFLARWYPAETDAEYKQSVYRIDAIKEVIDELGLQLTDLGTRDTGTFDIREVMYHDIRECDIFIADLTGARHNVMIEVGYALKHIDTGRMVFYFQETDSCKNVPFDVNHFSYDKIEDSVEIKAKTKARIMKILEQAKNGEI